MIFAASWLVGQMIWKPSKTIIAITNFSYINKDGTVVTSQKKSPISKALEEQISIISQNDPEVEILRLPVAYNDDEEGRQLAIKEGIQNRASILIWGAIQETFDPNVYRVITHFELLKHRELIPILPSLRLHCDSSVNVEEVSGALSLAELDHFVITLNADKRLIGLSSIVLGMINYDEGDFANAISYLSAAIDELKDIALEDRPINVHVLYFYKGNSLIAQEKYLEAIEQYDLALAESTEILGLPLNKAYAYQLNGDLNAAFAQYNAILKNYPSFLSNFEIKLVYAYAFNNRGLIHKIWGNSDVAYDDFTKAIQILPNYAEPHGARGDLLLSQGQYSLAFEDFEEALRIAPDSPCSYNDLGWGYLVTEKFDKAEKALKQALQLDPGHIKARINLAAVYASKEDIDQSIEEYNKLIEYNPDSDYCYFRRGGYYQSLGRNREAISDFTIAIQLQPKNGEYYAYRGLAYFDLMEYFNAILDFSSALQEMPQETDLYLNRGFAYALSDQFEKAIQDFSIFLEDNPTSADGYFNRGNSYFQLEDYHSALKDYTELIKYAPDPSMAYVTRAGAYMKIGEKSLAIADLQQGLSTCTEQPVCETAENLLSELGVTP